MGCGASQERVEPMPGSASLVSRSGSEKAEAAAAETAVAMEKAAAEFENARAAEDAPTDVAQRFGQQ